MADIDMIPRSYRDARRARRLLAGYAGALVLVLAGGALAGALLRWRIAAEMPALERMRAASVRAEAMRKQVAQAQQRKDALAQQAATLAALRGAGSAAVLAAALDAALNDKVWLDRLAFTRSQELLPGPLPNPAPPDTVLAYVAAQPGAPRAPQAWRLASRVELGGQALDRMAMTAFLSALAANPALADVRFLNSKTGADGQAAVGFSLAGSLRQGPAR